jgi:hypothetical protein
VSEWQPIETALLKAQKHASEGEAKFARQEIEVALSLVCGAEGGWQLIDTAPKDGTRVLGYDAANGRVDIVWYGTCELLPLTQREIDEIGEEAYFLPDWWQNCTDGAWRLERENTPTHWMPLPGPPSPFHNSENNPER